MDAFVQERRILIRETQAMYHRTVSYFLAKLVLNIALLQVIPVKVFVFIFYWLIGFKSELQAFLICWAAMVLFNIAGGAIILCISVASPTVGQANLVAAVWFLVMLLFGGFLISIETMAAWCSWLRYFSIFYYAFEILMTNELQGLLITFNAPGYPSFPVFGEVFLETIGMDIDNQTRNFACLSGLAIGFSIAAYVLLLVQLPASDFPQMERSANDSSLQQIVPTTVLTTAADPFRFESAQVEHTEHDIQETQEQHLSQSKEAKSTEKNHPSLDIVENEEHMVDV